MHSYTLWYIEIVTRWWLSIGDDALRIKWEFRCKPRRCTALYNWMNFSMQHGQLPRYSPHQLLGKIGCSWWEKNAAESLMFQSKDHGKPWILDFPSFSPFFSWTWVGDFQQSWNFSRADRADIRSSTSQLKLQICWSLVIVCILRIATPKKIQNWTAWKYLGKHDPYHRGNTFRHLFYSNLGCLYSIDMYLFQIHISISYYIPLATIDVSLITYNYDYVNHP